MSLASKPSKVRIFSWGVTSFQGTSLRCQGVKSESGKGVIITHIQKKVESAVAQQTGSPGDCESERGKQICI